MCAEKTLYSARSQGGRTHKERCPTACASPSPPADVDVALVGPTASGKSLMIYAGSNEVQITHVARGLLSDADRAAR